MIRRKAQIPIDPSLDETVPGTRLDELLREGAPVPPAPPPPGKWKRRLRLALVAGAVTTLGGALLAGGLVWFHSRDLPQWQSLREYNPKQTTRVYAADGTEAGEIFEERRTVVSMDEIPSVMVQALVAAEDANFFQHAGIDWMGLAKAAVGNLRPGAHLRGASTLTQQTVKTFLLSNERKLSRKIKEAILAIRLEKNLSKKDILYLYLNQIYFGNRRYGIEEAARYYFGKRARDIDLGEAALLASIPKSPNEINPRSNPRRAKERQAYVLRRMVEDGYVSKELAEREIARPLQLPPLPQTPPGGYYVEEVRRLLVQQLGEDAVVRGGLQVETWMVPELQGAAEDAVRQGLRELDKRQGWRGPLGNVDGSRWREVVKRSLERRESADRPRDFLVDAYRIVKALSGDAAAKKKLAAKRKGDEKDDEEPAEDGVEPSGDKDLDALARSVTWRPREVGRELVARVDRVSGRTATVDLGSATATLRLETTAWARRWNSVSGTAAPKSMADVVSPGDLVLVRVAKVNDCAKAKKACEPVEIALEQTPLVEGALVAIDQRTRGVSALVGGWDVRRSPFNRATQAKRQPGSSFKPFVYAAALEIGQARALLPSDIPENERRRCPSFNPRTTVFDTPELIRDRWTGKPWQPRNFERDFFAGPLSLRKALAESKNTVAVKLVAEIGCEPGFPMSEDENQDRGLSRVKDLARRAGIDSPIPDSITAPLGSGEVTPLELVNAYATFAALGRYAPPQFVRRVRSPSGEALVDNKVEFEQPPPLVAGQPPPPWSGRGLRPEVAYVTADVMRSVVEDPDGTARGLARLGRTIYGKTGTASEHRDAWFVGFTPEIVAGAWTGFDNHDMLGPRETGGHASGPIWLRFMQKATEVLPTGQFEPPPGVVVAQIDPRSGLLADPHSPYLEREVFLAGTEPTEAAPPPDEARPEDFLRGEGP